MADITLHDLNTFADRIERNSAERVGALRDEMVRIEKGIYHRLDDLRDELDHLRTRTDGAHNAIADLQAARTPARSTTPAVDSLSLSRKQLAAAVGLVLVLLINAIAVVQDVVTIAKTAMARMGHP